MKKLAKIDTLEATHVSEPGRMRADLLLEIGAKPALKSFSDLAARAQPTPENLTPEMIAAREQIAAAKRELNLAA